MTKAEVTALAERVEGLDGGDREVDAQIALATGKFFLAEPRYPGATRMYGYIDSDGCRVEPGNGGQYSLIPAYTASLDAAMGLVPEGYGFMIDGFGQKWWASLSEDQGFNSNAKSPALALTAAALRAIAASMEDE